MTGAAGAATASAVIAFLSMIGSGVGWFLARREKRAAGEHERRALRAAEDSAGSAKQSADAQVRAAAAQEAIAAETTAASAADMEAPWYFTREGDVTWVLHNRLARRAYSVKLTGLETYMADEEEADQIDGYSSHEFAFYNGSGERLTVTWHWLADLSDDVPPWTGRLP
jgi:hypothetical protein